MSKSIKCACDAQSALASLETRIGFVNNNNPALAADNPVVAVALGQRFYRAANFHDKQPGNIKIKGALKGTRQTWREHSGKDLVCQHSA